MHRHVYIRGKFSPIVAGATEDLMVRVNWGPKEKGQLVSIWRADIRDDVVIHAAKRN